MPETTTSTLSRVANALGVASKFSPKGSTPIDNILRMQHFTLWGFILLIVVIVVIIWIVQRKLDGIDKQYKEQYILLHRLFKSHQELQARVHKVTVPQEPVREPSGTEEPVQEPSGTEEPAEEPVREPSGTEEEEPVVEEDAPVDFDAY